MIPVNEPLISKNANNYVLDCIKTGWVSSAGTHIARFEEAFADFLGVKYALTTSSGTASLHLAISSLGIGKDDEVIIPDLTIISCALAVLYTGAKPVLVDVLAKSGNIDPAKIEEKITKNTKAIMVVHLYGQPANLEAILKIAKKHKLYVIEDAAEAHGAEIKIGNSWKKVGSIGDVGCFSFYGNKIITTGEGGMVVTNNKKIFEKAKSLKDLAHSKNKRFYHQELGFNYRMTNMQAALGLAQLEEVEKYLKIKNWMAEEYKKNLSAVDFLELPEEEPNTKSVYWMYAIKIAQNSKIKSQKMMDYLRTQGIDTRRFFYPLHTQPVLKKLGLFKNEKYPVSDDLSNRGFYLPSGLAITPSQIRKVSQVIKSFKDNLIP